MSPKWPYRLPHESPTAPFSSLEAHTVGNSPSNSREETWGGSGGRMGFRVESLRFSHRRPFQDHCPQPKSRASASRVLDSQDPHDASCLQSTFTHLICTPLCVTGTSPREIALCGRERGWLSKKESLPSSLGPGSTPKKRGNCSISSKFFH